MFCIHVAVLAIAVVVEITHVLDRLNLLSHMKASSFSFHM